MTIFVSHSTKKENKLANRALDIVEAELEARRPPIPYFLDRTRLAIADDFSAKIIAELAKTGLGIILISREALDLSSWVHFEAGVMFWRWQFNPDIQLLYVLIDVTREECHRVFSPQQSNRLKDLSFDKEKEDKFREQIRNLVERRVSGVWRTDPAYKMLREHLQKGGTEAARHFLEKMDSNEVAANWPESELFERVAIVLVTAPVDMKIIAGFDDYLQATIDASIKTKLAGHLKTQTTPLEYVARIRSKFFSRQTGKPAKAPSILYVTGTRTDLIKYHLERVFATRSSFNYYPISASDDNYDAISLESLRLALSKCDGSAPPPGNAGGDPFESIKVEAVHRPVFFALSSSYDLSLDIREFWLREFANLPVHLFVLRGYEYGGGRDGENSDLQAAEPLTIDDEPIKHLTYVKQVDETRQNLWITKINNSLMRAQE